MAAFAPPTTNEQDLLLAYLDLQRAGLRNAAFGLTDAEARLAPTVSTLSVGGLVKHVANVERFWIDQVVQQLPFPPMEESADGYQDTFRLLPNETLEAMLMSYSEVAAHTETVIREIADLNKAVPVPQDAPWFPKDVESWSVRWVLLHIIEETARHAGHADIVREGIDGATMYPLMAAAEGWPETEWLKPWKRA